MWNPRNNNQNKDEDESWEVKAFEQDIKGNIAGTTWPPRSYTCNFCRREFRSAQALGGHMNVHRRDRAARAHTTHSVARAGNPCVPPFPTLVIQSTASNSNVNVEGLCHFYQFPNPSGIFGNSADVNLCGTTSSHDSTALAFSPLDVNLCGTTSSRSIDIHVGETSVGSNGQSKIEFKEACTVDEPDLELRLGHKEAATPP